MTVTDLKYLLTKMNGGAKVFVFDGKGDMKELTEKMLLNDFLLSEKNGKLVQGDEIVGIYL
jgi:hypothetical protein